MHSLRLLALPLLLSLAAGACALESGPFPLDDGGPVDAAVDAELEFALASPAAGYRAQSLSRPAPAQVVTSPALSVAVELPSVQAAERPAEEPVVADVAVEAVQPEADGQPAEPVEPPPPPALPGVVRCGVGVICVPPVADPVTACEAALTLQRVEHTYAEPSSCTAPFQMATTKKGALRAAALLAVNEADMGYTSVVVLASERGFDRVVHYRWESEGMNESFELKYTKFAFQQLVPGGPAELHIESERTSEYWYCDESGGSTSKRADFGVCGVDARGQSYCLGGLPRRYESADFSFSFNPDKKTFRNRRKFILGFDLAGPSVSVRLKSGRLPEGLAPLLGTHSRETVRQVLSSAGYF